MEEQVKTKDSVIAYKSGIIKRLNEAIAKLEAENKKYRKALEDINISLHEDKGFKFNANIYDYRSDLKKVQIILLKALEE